LLRLIVYLIPAVGLVHLSLDVWDVRGTDFWIVWYYFFVIGRALIVPLAIFIGGRALYAEAFAEQPAMLASGDGAASQPATAGVTPPGSGTPA
jgi:hypothetical protein